MDWPDVFGADNDVVEPDAIDPIGCDDVVLARGIFPLEMRQTHAKHFPMLDTLKSLAFPSDADINRHLTLAHTLSDPSARYSSHV